MSTELRDLFNNEVIRASAGTGKTFELSNRFLRLIASGVHCETILATTFTRKGAGEILDRIVQRLASAALSQDAASKLADELNWSGLDRIRAQQLLHDLLSNLHRLQISTLDAFFYRIAQAFQLELGLPTDWDIAEEQQIKQLQNQVIREVLRKKTVVDLLHLLTYGEAGRRIADLIRATVDDLYQIYLISDREAWDRLPEPAFFNPNRNFDAVCEQLQSIEYPDKRQKTKVETEIKLIKSGDWLELANSSLFARIAEGNHFFQKPLPEPCVAAYQPLIEHCRDYIVDMLIKKNRCTYDLLDEFGKRFEQDKTDTGQLRFDDITQHLERFIGDRETDSFSFRLDHKVDHLLLDEFQDTSIPQWNVIRPFAERTTEVDARKSFFCVGDLKQAIFGWRGGVAEIFDRVEDQLGNVSDAQPLTTSYRSSPIVIDTVNRLFENLDKYNPDDNVIKQAVSNWAERFEHHQTSRNELPGYCTIEYAPDSEDKRNGRNPNVLQTTVQRIGQLRTQMPDRSIGVLVRTNETVGELIFMLQEAGIAASEEGGNPLTDSAAVEVILSAMALADHPGDTVARYHLSHGPLAGTFGLVPEPQEDPLQNYSAACAAAESLRLDIVTRGYGPVIERLAGEMAERCTRRELSRLQQLVQEAFNYDKSLDDSADRLRPARFVNHIRFEYKASDQSSAQVRVMTIHQSKGLEFDIVVLPMLSGKNDWFSRQDPVIVGRPSPTEPVDLVCRLANQKQRALLPEGFQEAFDETRRREVQDNMCVLYVAMTRAVHATHVVLSCGCKPDSKSGAGVLLATMVPDWSRELRESGIVYRHGDENWYRHIPEATGQSELDELQTFYLPPDVQLVRPTLKSESRSRRGMPRVSPSSLEGGETIRMSAIFSSLARSQQLQRGTLIHACFEKINWLDHSQPTDQELREQLKSISPVNENFGELIDEFREMIQRDDVRRLLTMQDYLEQFVPELLADQQFSDANLVVEAFNEHPFAVILDDELIQGTMDRLILIYQGDKLVAADVIDYKTDLVEDSQPVNVRIGHYRPQLDAYREAVSEVFKLPIERISTRIAFVETGQIVRLNNNEPDENGANGQHANPIDLGSREIPPPAFGSKKQMKLWMEE